MSEDVSDKFNAATGKTLHLRAIKIGKCVIVDGQCSSASLLSGMPSLFTIANDIKPYASFAFRVQCTDYDKGTIGIGDGFWWAPDQCAYAQGFGRAYTVSFSFSYLTV